MLKYYISLLTAMSIICCAKGQAESSGLTLEVKFDGAKKIQIGGKTVSAEGPFAAGADGINGLAFGSAQGISLPASSLCGNSGTLMFSFLLKSAKPENTLAPRYLLTLRGAARQFIGFYYIPSNGKKLGFAFKDYVSPTGSGSRGDLKFDKWHQAVCTWDGRSVKFYLDGMLEAETPQPFEAKFPESSKLYIGPFIDGYIDPAPWKEDNCLISELKVYDRALSQAEIMTAAGKETVAPGLKYKNFLRVPKVENPPLLDGEGDDAAWQKASSFVTLVNSYAPSESFALPGNNPLFCHDGKNIYVRFQTLFPAGAKIVKGEKRSDTLEPEVWGDESFELYFAIAGQIYRFAGNIAGGFCESLNGNSKFNGNWEYKSSLKMRIDDSQVWTAEISLPFKTIGLDNPAEAEVKTNACRTLRGLDKLGVTSLAGDGGYANKDNFVTLKISGAGDSAQINTLKDPNYGTLEQKVSVFSAAGSNFLYSAKLLSSQGAAPEITLLDKEYHADAGKIAVNELSARIDTACYDRLLFQVHDKKDMSLLMLQLAPFKILEDYVAVTPIFSAEKIILTPRYSLVKGKAGNNETRLELAAPDGKIIFETAVSSDVPVNSFFARGNPAGNYRADIFSVIDGKKIVFSSKTFHYSGVGQWENQPKKNIVLKPFEPLKAVCRDHKLEISVWGRKYIWENSVLPSGISALGKDVLSSAALTIGGVAVKSAGLKLTSASQDRAEFSGASENSDYSLTQDSWMEYDGVLWNKIRLTAKENLGAVKLAVKIPEEEAKFIHAAAAGFGGGGGFTSPLDKDMRINFYPTVWTGGQERGLSWFAESRAEWRTTDKTPVKMLKSNKECLLEITFADNLAKGQSIPLDFGFVATPVKPLPKNYPLNTFNFMFGADKNEAPPKAPVSANVIMPSDGGCGECFYDLPEDQPQPSKSMREMEKHRDFSEKNHALPVPYQAGMFVSDDYQAARDNLSEWRLAPENTLSYERDGRKVSFYWLCPASKTALDFYVWKTAQMVKAGKLRGLYFDFGPAYHCGNKLHGCHDRYPLLAKREFYKRIAEILAENNSGEYTIIVHNSEAVQMPVFTFATHFYNGEGLRQMSSDVFHNGKDLLDHYSISDFASEHSSLPWGVTCSVYVPTDPLLPQFGGDKEDGGPQELYRFRMTKAALAGTLIHNTIPAITRLHYGYFNKLVRFYDNFKVPDAEFMPYWRNQGFVKVEKGKDVYVSFYRHSDKKQLLAVISHVSKEHLDQEAVIEFNLPALGLKKISSANELFTGPDPEYAKLLKEKNPSRNPVKLGDFGVELTGSDSNKLFLKLKHHSVALVKIQAE